MLSLDLRQILLPKMTFFVCQKVQISSKILPQIPNFANYIKFRQKSTFSARWPLGQFLSFRQFFVKNEILWSLTKTIGWNEMPFDRNICVATNSTVFDRCLVPHGRKRFEGLADMT